jgi:phosphopantothenoylcysteine decarboxylase/phosphopantothenate--cysteine ligase
MGKALAEVCAEMGASVTFISGPVNSYPESSGIEVVKVQTAQEMLERSIEFHKQCDLAIFTAAVSDYKSSNILDKKQKREEGALSIEFVENPDIAAELGKQKKTHQFHMGFALETHDEHANAQKKLMKKNFDLIAMNSLNEEGAGFAHETNKITLFDSDNNSIELELMSKKEIASKIIGIIANRIHV